MAERKRSKRVHVRMTEQDLERLRQRAQQQNLSASEYVRNYIRDFEPEPAPTGDWKGITERLHEIGSAMNEVAYWANSTGVIDEETYHAQMEKLQECLAEIEKDVWTSGKNTPANNAGV